MPKMMIIHNNLQKNNCGNELTYTNTPTNQLQFKLRPRQCQQSSSTQTTPFKIPPSEK